MWLFERSYKRELEDIIKYSRLAYSRRLVSAAGGNVSARCGENVLITGSNVSLREVSADTLLFCDMDGNVLEGNGALRPSKETLFHLSVYASRPEVNAVLHTHPCYATAFSMIGEKLPLHTVSARLKLIEVPMIAEAQPGSRELAETVRRTVKDNPAAMAFLLRAHGAITVGSSQEECFNLAELLEDTAKIALILRQTNGIQYTNQGTNTLE